MDLPGTYSLLTTSTDEEVARDFLLFARPDVTVIVTDATQLERNLNLVLQVLEITDRVVVCLNLVDEAERKGIVVDERCLARDLGVPVVPTAARERRGLDRLVSVVAEMASGTYATRPHRIESGTAALQDAVRTLAIRIETEFPGLPNARWVALRLLDGDERMARAVESGELAELVSAPTGSAGGPMSAGNGARTVLELAESLRWKVGRDYSDRVTEAIYTDAARIAERAVSRAGAARRFDLDRAVDRLVTSRWLGFPLMAALLAVVFWLTIAGANLPSRLIASFLLDTIHPALKHASAVIGMPWWLDGLLLDGMYLAMAWVVAVMLPPMAIFFPLFTLLEDFGYLARVAFNLDGLFRRSGAHGKQALTMSMGWGCNAAGVVATRIIDSPRERLIAIITNNFALCNGRWPTQILVATIFIGSLVPAALAGVVSALGGRDRCAPRRLPDLRVVLGALPDRPSRRGVGVQPRAAAVSAAADPRRRSTPRSIDRTLIVLWRAVVFAAPRGCRDLAGVATSTSAGVERRGARHPRARSGRPVHRPERRDPPGLRGRDPGERDRDPHDPHAHRAHGPAWPEWAPAPA